MREYHLVRRGPNKILASSNFFFSSNLDETWSDFSRHEYYNMTKFQQDWKRNKKNLLHAKILPGPLKMIFSHKLACRHWYNYAFYF